MENPAKANLVFQNKQKMFFVSVISDTKAFTTGLSMHD